jgi:hypothetical protein
MSATRSALSSGLVLILWAHRAGAEKPSPARAPAAQSVPARVGVADGGTRAAPIDRGRRVAIEGAVAVGAGVLVPAVIYFGATQARSFDGFFAGFGGSVLAAPVLGVTGAYLAHRALGGTGGLGWASLGAGVGLLGGMAAGLPLATLPSGAYVSGLFVLWTLPSVGAVLALERSSAAGPRVMALPSANGVTFAGVF